MLDRLAEKVGIDGYDIRDRNILEPGEAFATGQVLDKPFGLRKTLEAVKDALQERQVRRHRLRHQELSASATACPISASRPCTSTTPNTIHIRTGFTEMGQGLFTLCIQFAVEATGLPADVFKKVSTDTKFMLDCGQTTASRGTVLAGNSIAEAGKQLKAELASGKTLADLVGQTFIGEWSCTYTSKLGYDLDKPGGPKTHLTYGFATQVAILDDDGRLVKMVAAHDVGRVLNPSQLEGQMYGSLHMGIGYALTEDFEAENGVILAKKMNDCGVLRSHQMPEMELIFVEEARSGMPARRPRRRRDWPRADGPVHRRCALQIRRHRSQRAADARFTRGDGDHEAQCPSKVITADIGVILAAGRGRRMGGKKQLTPWPGTEGSKPLVAASYDSIRSICDDMVVVLGHIADSVVEALGDRLFHRAESNSEMPMFESIRAGLRTALFVDPSAAVVLQPCDHPEVAPSTLRTLMDESIARPHQAIIPQFESWGGHPVIIPPSICSKLIATECPDGLGQFWLDHSDLCHRVPINDPMVVRDIDKPADLG